MQSFARSEATKPAGINGGERGRPGCGSAHPSKSNSSDLDDPWPAARARLAAPGAGALPDSAAWSARVPQNRKGAILVAATHDWATGMSPFHSSPRSLIGCTIFTNRRIACEAAIALSSRHI